MTSSVVASEVVAAEVDSEVDAAEDVVATKTGAMAVATEEVVDTEGAMEQVATTTIRAMEATDLAMTIARAMVVAMTIARAMVAMTTADMASKAMDLVATGLTHQPQGVGQDITVVDSWICGPVRRPSLVLECGLIQVDPSHTGTAY